MAAGAPEAAALSDEGDEWKSTDLSADDGVVSRRGRTRTMTLTKGRGRSFCLLVFSIAFVALGIQLDMREILHFKGRLGGGRGGDEDATGGTMTMNLTSLEMMDIAMRRTANWTDAAAVSTPPMPKCLLPDTERSKEILRKVRRKGLVLPTPILNVGFPKIGSKTLWRFFQCAGYFSTHNLNAMCMKENVESGNGPLRNCGLNFNVEAFMQMDITYPRRNECYYPQLSLLDEIHAESPNATFVMNFRPVADWIRSVRSWHGMDKRLFWCDLPGLPFGAGSRDVDYYRWFCAHVEQVRQFAARHPSHNLIEIDLYDEKRTADLMAGLFSRKIGSSSRKGAVAAKTATSCWGHANANKRIVPKKRKGR